MWTMFATTPITEAVLVAFVRDGYPLTSSAVWHSASWTDDPSTVRTLTVLVAGPDCSPLPLGAVQLPSGKYVTWIKIEKTPQKIIRRSQSQLVVK